MGKNIIFVYDHEYPHLWKDGLWAALELLEQDFKITRNNLQDNEFINYSEFDFVLGWGGFESPVEKEIRDLPNKKGLCIGGNAFPPDRQGHYDVLFYETDWYKQFLNHKNVRKAFGVNTQIFKPMLTQKIYDYISVGAFSNWKRQHLIREKIGNRLVIGQIQEGNIDESMGIVVDLVLNGIAVSDMVSPETLAKLYNSSRVCYIPADINGGGERAVMEALACGIEVEIEPDNQKLQGVIDGERLSEKDYYKALKSGIKSVL